MQYVRSTVIICLQHNIQDVLLVQSSIVTCNCLYFCTMPVVIWCVEFMLSGTNGITMFQVCVRQKVTQCAESVWPSSSGNIKAMIRNRLQIIYTPIIIKSIFSHHRYQIGLTEEDPYSSVIHIRSNLFLHSSRLTHRNKYMTSLYNFTCLSQFIRHQHKICKTIQPKIRIHILAFTKQ